MSEDKKEPTLTIFDLKEGKEYRIWNIVEREWSSEKYRRHMNSLQHQDNDGEWQNHSSGILDRDRFKEIKNKDVL